MPDFRSVIPTYLNYKIFNQIFTFPLSQIPSFTQFVTRFITALHSAQTILQSKEANVLAVSGGTDIEAVEIFGPKSFYEALRRVLQSVKLETSINPSEEIYVSLSAYLWVVEKVNCSGSGHFARN